MQKEQAHAGKCQKVFLDMQRPKQTWCQRLSERMRAGVHTSASPWEVSQPDRQFVETQQQNWKVSQNKCEKEEVHASQLSRNSVYTSD